MLDTVRKYFIIFLGVFIPAVSKAAIEFSVIEENLEPTPLVDLNLRLHTPGVATVVDAESVIVVGGIEGDTLSPRVYRASDTVIEEMPAFPTGIAFAGAEIHEGQLFVVGGRIERSGSDLSSKLYSLHLDDPQGEWVEHEALPGLGRESPTVVSLNGELHVFGGRGNEGDLSEVWGYRTKPLDGTTEIGWRQMRDMPRASSRASAIQTGHVHAVVLGGNEATDEALIYHTVTDTWVVGGHLPVPVGICLVEELGDDVYLIDADGKAILLHLDYSLNVLSSVDFGVIVLYFGLMAAIGVYFARKQKSSDEFALGGRKVKWWAAGISMFATAASSISFMALPAQAFRTNLVWFTPVLALIPCFFLQAYVLFPLLRRLQLTSTYEYLEQRFHPLLRLLASFQCIAFQVFGRMSVVLLLPSLAISAVTGIDVSLSVLVMGILTTAYTSVGGFEAVVWTDVIQGVLMFLGALLISFVAIMSLQGRWGEFVEVGKDFNKFDLAIFSFDYAQPVIWLLLLSVFFQQITIVSDQTTVQRVFSTPLKDVRKIAAMSMVCGIGISISVFFAGVAIFAYFHGHPEQLIPTMTNDQIVPLFIVERLPVGVAGLIIAALFAASMSTLSSSINSVAILVSEDFFSRLKKNATDRQRLHLMKVVTLIVGSLGTGIAFYMAQLQIESLFQIFSELLALLGGGFVGIYILGMFTRRTHALGAAIGAISSVICTIMLKNYTDVHWAAYTPAATFCCMIVGYLASILIPMAAVKNTAGLTVFDSKDPVTEN
ncbi:MAG: sodium:solute symporter family transporter [Opitutales bacterium]